MQKWNVAKVYIDKTTYRMDMAFDYIIPQNLTATLKRGCRVVVPFGNSNRKKQGMVCDIYETTELVKQLKPISSQLDAQPVFNEEMFKITEFLVKNTFCTYYDAIKTILPIGTSIDFVENYKLTTDIETLTLSDFSDEECRIIEFLRLAKTEKQLCAFLDCKTNPSKKPVVKRLIEKNIVCCCDEPLAKVAPKLTKMVKICDDIDPITLRLTPKQQSVISLLKDTQVADTKELCYLCGVGESVIKGLANKGIVEFFSREREKIYTPANTVISLDNVVLSDEQIASFDGISKLVSSRTPNVALLHGITGSGKTQVYIKLIEQVINGGRQAMLLVPEIALTPQLVDKFKLLFGDIVTVVHSRLSLSERLEQYNRIKAGSVSIVIGTRSAVFSPFSDIGIIILDEEGEQSYKSDSSPRYHAREVAKLRSVIHNATVVLGSATPSVDSFYRASEHRYSLFSINLRYSGAELPDVYIVDMLNEQQQKNFSPLSEVLQEQIAINLKKNEQTILLINRRGYNTFATCMECGEVLKCQYCSVSMTYHKANKRLMCHYCGHTEKYINTCTACGGEYIKLTGAGTQKLEDEISLLFPKARVLRMDSDTTYSKDAFEQNFDDFRSQKYDIMVGTQMVAKGLDFPNVTLVGVIGADSGLYSTDYASGERIFSLITQVIGRSGRSEKSGRAYIQTLNPNHSVISYAANQDYLSFYQDELAVRKLLTYPPFCDICVLGFSGLGELAVEHAAHTVLDLLIKNAKKHDGLTMKILGVSPADIYKINNKFRYRIIIKCRFNNKFKAFLGSTLKEISTLEKLSEITVFADINGNINV